MVKSGHDRARRPSEFFFGFNKVSKHEFVIEDTNGTFKIEHGKMFSVINKSLRNSFRNQENDSRKYHYIHPNHDE